VLSLPSGVTGDQDDTAEGLTADLSDVVLEEAVGAIGTSKLELLAVIERADRKHD